MRATVRNRSESAGEQGRKKHAQLSSSDLGDFNRSIHILPPQGQKLEVNRMMLSNIWLIYPAKRINPLHRGFIKFRVLSWTPFSTELLRAQQQAFTQRKPCSSEEQDTSTTGTFSVCLQLLGISGKKQLGVGVHAWNHRKPRQESAASLGCVVKPLPPQINKGRHEGRERHAKEPPRPKSVSVANNTIAMTEQVIKARGLLCSKVKRSSLLTTSSRSDLATEWIQNQHYNKMKCHN